MPACSDCSWLPKCQAAVVDGRSVKARACNCAVLEKYLPQLLGDVLEIGHGIWRYPRRVIGEQANWNGIDPRWPDNPKLNHRQGTAANIPFPDESQDWVLALQTMEHWYELGETPRQGVKEIHRVLRTGGRFLCVVPIHYHGDPVFYFKRDKVINRIFDFLDWRSVSWEPWRRDYEPLPQGVWWQETRNGKNVDKLRKRNPNASSWQLEILAVKA